MKDKERKLLDRLTEGREPSLKVEAKRILQDQLVLDDKVSTDWTVIVHATAILRMHKEEGMTGVKAREGVREMVQELLTAIQRHPSDHIYVEAPVIKDARL